MREVLFLSVLCIGFGLRRVFCVCYVYSVSRVWSKLCACVLYFCSGRACVLCVGVSSVCRHQCCLCRGLQYSNLQRSKVV